VPAVFPRTPSLRRRRVIRAVRVIGAGTAVAAIVGLALTFIPAPSQAATSDDSSLTVAWNGDTSTAASLQPSAAVRSANPEFDEFKNITVTVGQTKNLIDQAVHVTVKGFAGGTQAATNGNGSTWSTGMNYMQAMQCWGDPAKSDFRTTCQWGGRYVSSSNGLGNTVYSDNVLRVSRKLLVEKDLSGDVPYVTPDAAKANQPGVSGMEDAKGNYPILTLFGPGTTNELQGARVDSSGSGDFEFELQSGSQSPQLGCGQAGLLTCYLVLVPRGTIYLGHDDTCSDVTDASHKSYTYGRVDSLQGGSPLNPSCDYWDNRIVVPLSFNPVNQSCPKGSAEQRIVGSQLLIGAMGSWQPALCTSAGSTFSFQNNPDSVARGQLLQKQANLAFSSYPIVRKDLDNPSDQDAFDSTQVSYAPVAIGATVVSFIADGARGQITKLNLSPRLVAKLLTQSYVFTVPSSASDPGMDDFSQLGDVNQSYLFWSDDPEFQKLNPSNWQDFAGINPSLVLPGPSGSDAIAQLWKWVQSDAKARDFLNGKPDEDGMTVNPYYLPRGAAGAKVLAYDLTTGQRQSSPTEVGLTSLDGSPRSLASATIDNFIKADESQVPHVLTTDPKLKDAPKFRYDSSAFAPYVDDFSKSAVVTFRANPGGKTSWNPTAINARGDSGDWVSTGPQLPGSRFVISISDEASALRYDLPTASLQAADGTQLSAPDAAGMAAAAASGLSATSISSVRQIDPAKVAAGGYPLTTLVYAVTNLSATDAATRQIVSKFIRYAAADGQKQGTQVGQLPPGYLPLTSDLSSQATAAATAIANWTPPAGTSYTPPSDVQLNTLSLGGSQVDDSASASSTGTTTSSVPAKAAGITPAGSVNPVGQWALAVALGVGVAGALGAPLLFRRGRA
jgi:hypothetical protein